jgi:hypothetical protein
LAIINKKEEKENKISERIHAQWKLTSRKICILLCKNESKLLKKKQPTFKTRKCKNYTYKKTWMPLSFEKKRHTNIVFVLWKKQANFGWEYIQSCH